MIICVSFVCNLFVVCFRLYLVYKRMRNFKCIEIDVSGLMEKVLELVREEINKLN